jgi:hypothetical protein
METPFTVYRVTPKIDPKDHWSKVLADPQASAARRKKAVVAVARRLGVDLWRLATGRATAAQLGLECLAG